MTIVSDQSLSHPLPHPKNLGIILKSRLLSLDVMALSDSGSVYDASCIIPHRQIGVVGPEVLGNRDIEILSLTNVGCNDSLPEMSVSSSILNTKETTKLQTLSWQATGTRENHLASAKGGRRARPQSE